MDLRESCDISGKNAVSCIIDGIPNATIQSGAKAGRNNGSQSLYSEFLATLPDDKILNHHHKSDVELISN